MVQMRPNWVVSETRVLKADWSSWEAVSAVRVGLARTFREWKAAGFVNLIFRTASLNPRGCVSREGCRCVGGRDEGSWGCFPCLVAGTRLLESPRPSPRQGGGVPAPHASASAGQQLDSTGLSVIAAQAPSFSYGTVEQRCQSRIPRWVQWLSGLEEMDHYQLVEIEPL